MTGLLVAWLSKCSVGRGCGRGYGGGVLAIKKSPASGSGFWKEVEGTVWYFSSLLLSWDIFRQGGRSGHLATGCRPLRPAMRTEVDGEVDRR